MKFEHADGTGVNLRRSFCGWTLTGAAQCLVVEDASQDARFMDSLAVTDGPRLRFYAGSPLLVRASACNPSLVAAHLLKVCA